MEKNVLNVLKIKYFYYYIIIKIQSSIMSSKKLGISDLISSAALANALKKENYEGYDDNVAESKAVANINSSVAYTSSLLIVYVILLFFAVSRASKMAPKDTVAIHVFLALYSPVLYLILSVIIPNFYG